MRETEGDLIRDKGGIHKWADTVNVPFYGSKGCNYQTAWILFARQSAIDSVVVVATCAFPEWVFVPAEFLMGEIPPGEIGIRVFKYY